MTNFQTNQPSSIAQLKQIRAEAIARLRESQDFKLAGRLGALIVELGETLDDQSALTGLDAGPGDGRTPVTPFASKPSVFAPKPVAPVAPVAESATRKADEEEESEILDELVAEIKNDMADLDRTNLNASVDDAADGGNGATVKPFLTRFAESNADTAKTGLAG